MLATRLVTQMSAAHVGVLLMACGLIAPFCAALVREGRQDARKALVLGLTILAVVAALMASLDASGVPKLDQCDVCRQNLPAWLCWLQGCW